MAQLQQLVYISRATFAESREGRGVPPEMGRILVQSRLNNPRRGLVGALYYGNGCFFQCLEGPAEAIDALYAKLLVDPRHKDLKVLQRHDIQGPHFSEWAMKYVPDAQQVQALMKQHRLRSFDPYRFELPTVNAMVDLLHQANESAGITSPETRRAPRPRSWLIATICLAAIVIALLAWLALRP